MDQKPKSIKFKLRVPMKSPLTSKGAHSRKYMLGLVLHISPLRTYTLVFESLAPLIMLALLLILSEAIILHLTPPWLIFLSIKLIYSLKRPQLSILASARQAKHGPLFFISITGPLSAFHVM